MAPIAIDTPRDSTSVPVKGQPAHQQQPLRRTPLQLTGILDHFAFEESTPAIGREYKTLDVKRDLFEAPDSDAKLRELAIIISRRGFVALRNQDLTPKELQEFTARLSTLSGTPAESGLHIHPVLNGQRDKVYRSTGGHDDASTDDTISVISSEFRKKTDDDLARRTGGGKREIHSDVAFEPVPADYSTLYIHTNVDTGGDTIFYSGYALYDRLSPAFAKLLEGLEGRFAQPGFNRMAAREGFSVHPGPRGHPDNSGEALEAFHPAVRTNPVTGWKSVFAVGSHFDSFPALTPDESTLLRDYLIDQVASTHASAARVKWENSEDGSTLVVFDNRSVFHAATPDYFASGQHRVGNRVVSVGEKPYLDPQSGSRQAELGAGRYI